VPAKSRQPHCLCPDAHGRELRHHATGHEGVSRPAQQGGQLAFEGLDELAFAIDIVRDPVSLTPVGRQAEFGCGVGYGEGPRETFTMNISLPDRLRSFVDKQVGSRGFGTTCEYVREQI